MHAQFFSFLLVQGERRVVMFVSSFSDRAKLMGWLVWGVPYFRSPCPLHLPQALAVAQC